MKNRRDLIILGSLFALLVLFTILGPGRQTEDEEMTFSPTTHSSGPSGALALLRWSNELGYTAERLEFREFAVDAQTDVLFMLNPPEPVLPNHAEMVLAWVEESGGILVLSRDRANILGGNSTILDELDIRVAAYQGEPQVIERAPLQQPALHTPPVQDVLVDTGYVLETPRSDVVHLVGVEDGTVLMGVQHGEGYIYLSSSSYPFTNRGLRDSQNAVMVLNLLRRTPEGGRILFDEYHHGFFEPPSFRSILFSTPWGWALIYALAVLALYAILTGRRFGRPVPLLEEVRLRSSAEYVESMADLLQRGRKTRFIQEHYYTSFKRRLARPYGINPHLEDDAFVAELARYRELDHAKLLGLLTRLHSTHLDEKALLRVLEETREWTA